MCVCVCRVQSCTGTIGSAGEMEFGCGCSVGIWDEIQISWGEGRLYVPKYGEGSGARLLLSCLAAMQAGGIVQERELWMSRSSFFLVRSAAVLVELRIDRE